MQFIEQKDVNILNFMPQKRVSFPCFKHTLWMAAVIAVLFSLFSIYPWLNIRSLERSIVSLKSGNKTALIKLQQAKFKLNNAKGRYITTLNNPIDYQENQFSLPLSAIASKRLDGLWLYDIVINNNTKQVKILGRSFKASGLYKFLDFLNGLKAFAGNHFSVVSIASGGQVNKISTRGQVAMKSAVNSVNKQQFSAKNASKNQVSVSPDYNFEIDNRGHAAFNVSAAKNKLGARLIIPKPIIRRKITLS